jgi:hypothetical protein
MKLIKTFEAYGEPTTESDKQFKVIKKGKGLMPTTFTPDMINDMWGDLLSATDFDGIKLSVFVKKSKLRDSWENNNLKLVCVKMDTTPTNMRTQNTSNPQTDQFQVKVVGSVSKRVSTYKLNGEDILKTMNAKNDDTLVDFITKASIGEVWKSNNIEMTKI